MKKYNVGLVGVGAVGAEMIKVLRERQFPRSEEHTSELQSRI